MNRFVRFNVVGVAGFAVQVAALAAMHALGVPVVLAACIAVEAAIVHNFAWHERWTWRGLGGESRGRRFIRFHLANGLISIAGNAVVTSILVAAGAPVAVAMLVAVLVCAPLNFGAAHTFVFRDSRSALSIPQSAVDASIRSAAL